MDFGHALAFLIPECAARGISHAVIGGVALAIWGVPRTTLDLDLVVDGDRQADVLAILASLGYQLLHQSTGYSNHRHSDPEKGQVDIVYVRNGTRDQVFAATTQQKGPRGLAVPVASPEHLAAMKVRAMRNDPSRRERDLEDLRSLARATDSQTVRKLLEEGERIP